MNAVTHDGTRAARLAAGPIVLDAVSADDTLAPVGASASDDPASPAPSTTVGLPTDPSLLCLALALAQQAVDRRDAGQAARTEHARSTEAGDAARACRARARGQATRAERVARPRARWVRRLVRALTVVAGLAATVLSGGAGLVATVVAAGAALAQAGRGVAGSALRHASRRSSGAADAHTLEQKRAAQSFDASVERLGAAQRHAAHALTTHTENARRRAELELSLVRPQNT